VARNRKRAKERRTRRPPQAGSRPGAQGEVSSIPGVLPGVPTVTRDDGPGLEPAENGAPEPVENGAPEPVENGAPDPLEHAMPDVEFAEAQLAAGRPGAAEPEDEADEEELELEVEESIEEGRGGRGGGRFRGGGRGGSAGGTGGGPAGGSLEPVAAGAVPAEHRAGIFERLIGFLQGSWRELQRVQWPDRRQVMQATGVVIGFVIVAAAFLGAADWAAGKVVTFILK